MLYSTFIRVLVCLGLVGVFSLLVLRVPAAPLRKTSVSDGLKQAQESPIVVNGQTLTGPNSTAQRRSGRLFLPVLAVTRALGDVVAISDQTRSIAVRRQTGVTAEFDAGLGQVRENGQVRLSVSNTAEIVFPPNQETFYLPIEIISELLDVSTRFEEPTNLVIINRGLPAGGTVRSGEKHGLGEIYSIDYDYGLNSYSSFASHNLGLNATGRIGDGRFTIFTGLTQASRRGWRLGTGTFTLDRPGGQRFVAGDLGTGTELQLLSTNIRGASVQIPVNNFRLTAFAGRTFSGIIVPQIVGPSEPGQSAEPNIFYNRVHYDTNVFGVFATTTGPQGRLRPLTFSAGVMRFSGANRSADVVSGGVKFENRRFHLQGDVGIGNFDGISVDGRRVKGLGEAIDLSGSVELTENFSVQARYTHIGKDFLSAQTGAREPLDLKSAGVTWSPKKWLSTTIIANMSERPGDRTQHNRYVTGTLNISRASSLWPQIFVSHTQSSSAQLRGSAFTLVTASRDFSQFRVFVNATRIKTFGAAALNTQAGVNYRLNDSNSVEVSQGIGTRGMLNGQIDWRTAGLWNKRLNFSAGVGYNRSGDSGFSTFERLTASLRLPRQNALQVSYTQTNAGPTIMVSLRGSLFRRRSADVLADASVSEANSFGKISGRVYQDINLNGKFDADIDQPQAHVQVRVDGNRYVVTGADGSYIIDVVRAGKHQVYVDLLSVRADLTLLDGAAQGVTLVRGRDSIVDFRLVRTGRISGIVWLDLNENGKMDEKEQPLSDVRVVAGNGRDTLTDQNGFFVIGDLPPGEVVILVDEKTLPAKTRSGAATLSVRVLAGREISETNFAVTAIPAEIKRFATGQ